MRGGGAGGGQSVQDDHGDMSTMNTTIKTRDSVTFKNTGGDTISDNTTSTDQVSEKTTKTPYTARSLDLRTNENQFHVIASLIVDKYENILTSGAESFRLTAIDKIQLDRLVPTRIRHNFVEAVKLRLQSCPEQITRPIHVVLRKCEALGLDRNGTQNLLFAPEGTIIFVHHQGKQIMDDISVAQSARSTEETPEERLARRQLLAEHREASNLMAESVTPEAAQFWRKHVVDLQARLRSLHAKSGNVRVSDEAEQIMRNNEVLLASLKENTGYVPPQEDFFQEIRSRQAVEPPVQYSAPQHEIVERAVEDGALPLVDVVAPSDLPGGYTFEAEISGKRFLATVPAGGVRKGDTFSSVMKNLEEPGNTDGAPTKKWRDSFFACFKHGCFHPLVTNAIFCPLIALAQIMTRLRLDFLGRPASYNTPKEGPWSTFGMIQFIISFWLFLNCVIVSGVGIKLLTHAGISGADLTSLALVNLAMFLYAVYAVASTRRSIREKYDFEESHRFADQEDILCATCCMSCTICQMGRHSADYENHRATFFTDTGLQKVTCGEDASEFEMV